MRWSFVAVVVGLAFAAGAEAAPASCQVTRVVDGDTLHVTCDGVAHKVRLLGFDTPEVFHPRCRSEKRAGERAAEVMAALVAAGPVTLVRFSGQDRYGRDLGQVEINGRDVAKAMLASGLALAYAGGQRPDWCGEDGQAAISARRKMPQTAHPTRAAWSTDR